MAKTGHEPSVSKRDMRFAANADQYSFAESSIQSSGLVLIKMGGNLGDANSVPNRGVESKAKSYGLGLRPATQEKFHHLSGYYS